MTDDPRAAAFEQAEEDDSILMAAKAGWAMAVWRLQQAISATKEQHLLPLTAEECVTILEHSELPTELPEEAMTDDLATVTKERDNLEADYLKAAKDRTEYHDALAEVRAERDALREEHDKDIEFLMVKREAAEGSVERLERELAEARAEIARLNERE